jgi:hypothetical protein
MASYRRCVSPNNAALAGVGQVSIIASFGTKFQQQGGVGRGSLLTSCTCETMQMHRERDCMGMWCITTKGVQQRWGR